MPSPADQKSTAPGKLAGSSDLGAGSLPVSSAFAEANATGRSGSNGGSRGKKPKRASIFGRVYEERPREVDEAKEREIEAMFESAGS